MKPRHIDTQHAIAVFLIVAASCLRAFVCFQHNPVDYLWSDMMRHWFAGKYFPKAGYDGAADPILYQAYMFALHKITFDQRYLIALASALMSVVMPWTYYRAARNFGLRKMPSLWLWALIAWTPSLFTIYHYLMGETLLLLLEGMALWATARYQRKGGGILPFLVMVLAWTLACLTKPTLGPLGVVLVLWVCWKSRPSPRAIAAAVALVILMLIPQGIRTYVELGFVAPFGNPWFTKIQHRSGAKYIHVRFYSRPNALFHTHGQLSDLMASSPSCNMHPLWPLSHWVMERANRESWVTLSIDAAHGEQDWKSAYKALDVGWEEWLRQWRENIVLFLFAPSWPESAQLQWDGLMEFYARWLWAPLVIFLLIANFRHFLRGQVELIPVAVTFFMLFLALQNVVTFEGRYRKPLEPLLLLNLVWIVATRHRGHVEQPLDAAQEKQVKA